MCGQARARWESWVSLCLLWIFRGLAGTEGSPPTAAAGESTRSPALSRLRKRHVGAFAGRRNITLQMGEKQNLRFRNRSAAHLSAAQPRAGARVYR